MCTANEGEETTTRGCTEVCAALSLEARGNASLLASQLENNSVLMNVPSSRLVLIASQRGRRTGELNLLQVKFETV